jgi:DNA-binding response OmpR family regulator
VSLSERCLGPFYSVVFTRRIRSEKHGKPDIPIIALTAYAMKGDREKFTDNGMDGYVTKPVDSDELVRVIAKCADYRREDTPTRMGSNNFSKLHSFHITISPTSHIHPKLPPRDG